MKRQQRKVGMVVRIPVGNRDGFAQVLTPPEVAVLDIFKGTGDTPTTDDLRDAASLFRVWVMDSAIKSGRWQRIGMMPVRPAFQKPVPRFKRDPITGHFSIYMNGQDRPASPSECIGLEPASVWSAEHVEARLKDHLAGQKHRPLEMLLEGIPSR